MTGIAFNSFAAVILVASAGLLMVLSGLQKKLLRRRESVTRCRTCGRTDRYNCACRR
jgi:hypothetical protein